MAGRSHIARHLPYLRRYARMLCGDRSVGDALLATAVQKVLDDPQALERCCSVNGSTGRIAHRAFNIGCMSLDAALVAALPPLARQASILVALERLSPEDAACVLGVDEPSLSALLERDRAALRAEPRGALLILDAEPFITIDVEMALEQEAHRIVGKPKRGDDALALARSLRPDVVIATGTTIVLQDGARGLDITNAVTGICGAEAVVMSGYPEALLTGKDSEPAFLVSKPHSPEGLLVAVGQALAAARGMARARPRADGLG